MRKLSTTCFALFLPISLAWACGSGDEGDGSGSGASSTGATAASSSSGSGTMIGGEGNVTTGGTLPGTGGTTGTAGTTNNFGGAPVLGDTACSNGEDDDDDGLIDGFDPECTGPWDNDESTFATGIPGDNVDPKWQDCFYDGNSGAGDDDCRYATGCLTGELKPTDASCKLTDACIEFCAPLTPNGCDCFGCCTVDTADGPIDIQGATTCSVANVDDEEACPRCVRSDACGNTCGRCELCPGKTIADLPDDCAPTGTGGAPSGTGGAPDVPDPGYTCDGGEQVCGPDLAPCNLGWYCAQGCCLQQPPK
jgi:hypothetical protein